jgi:hypothetical protein
MSSKLVQVSASALRWVNSGLCVTYRDACEITETIIDVTGYYAYSENGKVKIMRGRYMDTIASTDKIQVKPTDYTAAVIERIREMMSGTLIMVLKNNEGVFAITQYNGEPDRRCIPVKADPWPWAESGEWGEKWI